MPPGCDRNGPDGVGVLGQHYHDAMDVEVVVEIPKGTRNKYEADHETGEIWLDRMLFTSTRYPEDYGYVPGTLASDGDPLDALVLLEEPTFPGCHIKARPVGVFMMRDEAGDDAKLPCVIASDPRQADVQDLSDLPAHELEEIAHFFAIYKSLEPGKRTELGGWKDRKAAEAILAEARQRYLDQPGS
jgi:inorganic pyrophosphatase